MMISNFCTSPLFCFIIEVASYLAFLGLFAYVILLKFCIRITFYEYLLVVWMLSIQLERVRKFIAISDKTKSEKFRLMVHDTWNILYLLAIVTFLTGIILRGVSVVSYEQIYNINMKSFENLPNNKINVYNTTSWNDFQAKYKFSAVSAFFSNKNNPLYTEMTPEAQEFVGENYGIYPFEFINGIDNHPASLNYCPLHILENASFENPKFLKWAQIFYGITFLIMCMAVLHFYDIHKLLGPLAISIGRMMRDLMMFIFILAVFLVPYGVITTALLYPNEVRLADCLEGIFFKPILNLYGDLFLTEYTNYEFNDDLDGCVVAEDIRSVETENDLYSGFDFVRVTPIMKNFTHEWERDIKLWNVCSPEHMSQMTAFYLTNYDCDFGENTATSSGNIECTFLDGNQENAKKQAPIPLTDIFDECFEKVRVLRVKKTEIDKYEKLLPTAKQTAAKITERHYKYFQSFEGADVENFEYFTFSPWRVYADGPVPAPVDFGALTDDELYNLLVEHVNNPVDDFAIFPSETVHKFAAFDDIPSSARLADSQWNLDIFERRTTKGVALTFNDLLPSCSVDEKVNSCTSSKKQPVVLAAMIVYSFGTVYSSDQSYSICQIFFKPLKDKRRFNFRDPLFMSNIPAEGSKNKDQKLQNFKDLYFPTLAADTAVERKDLTSEMLLLEYFHDDDVDYVSVEDGTTTEIADIPQGIVHQKTLLLFYAKKFSRCPERYFVNSFFLGVYMMVANVMLINLLVALFATTYETVQEDSDKIWKLNRFDLVMDYWGKDPIPTPLILVYHIMLLIKYACFSCGEKKNRRTTIVCWPRIPGDHAVNLKQFPLKEYPPTGKDSNSKNAENSKTIDSLIRNLVDFEKVEVQAAIEKGGENEEPAEVMRQMNEKLERLKESVLQLQTRLRKRNKDD